MRNHEGRILAAYTQCQLADDVFTTEAIAAHLALQIAEEQQCSKVILEGDVINVICALQGHSTAVEWRGQTVIEESIATLAKWP